jgi:hypothetical protein
MTDPLPDWHHGFLAGYRIESGDVNLTPVVIKGARMVWGGKTFAGLRIPHDVGGARF